MTQSIKPWRDESARVAKLKPLPLSYYRRETLSLAPDILGKILVRNIRGKILAGRIVEIEAYRSNDPASHAFRGMTERNKVMFEGGGVAYVYFTYGMHFCFNIVTEAEGSAAAFLVRALEPMAGLKEMKHRRGGGRSTNLTNGPARLCQAMRIDRSLNGVRLDGTELYICDDGFRVQSDAIESSPRIGIREGKNLKWRFFLKGNEFLSRRQPRK
ncbi:MAG TPA: DNA-3-methyladenine glycosylase [Candidatus Kryptonia bacterium]